MAATPDHPDDPDKAAKDPMNWNQLTVPKLQRVLPINHSIVLPDGAIASRIVLVALALHDSLTTLYVLGIAPDFDIDKQSERYTAHIEGGGDPAVDMWYAVEDNGTSLGDGHWSDGGSNSVFWTPTINWRAGISPEATSITIHSTLEYGLVTFTVNLDTGNVTDR